MSWLFSEEYFLDNSPSRKQLTIQQDLKTRESIYDFTIRLGSALKVSGKTILAATIYISRYYMRLPITTSKYFVACAALCVSCKINDNYRAPDKIALTAAQIKNPHKQLDEHSEIFWNWRDQLLYREELLLKNLNFDLNLDLPYEFRESLLLKLKEEESKKISTENNSGEMDNGNGNDDENENENENDNLQVDDLDVNLNEDPAVDDDAGPSVSFYDQMDTLTKETIILMEILASLPVLVCYSTNAFFGASMIMQIYNNDHGNANTQEFSLPPNFLDSYVAQTESCYQCYKFICKLLKLGESSNPQLSSNRGAAKKVPLMDRDKFFSLANASVN